MSAKVRFVGDQPEYRFDFTFAAISKEPPAPVLRAAQTQPLAQPAATALPTPAGAAPVDTSLVPLPIPATMSGILEQLQERQKQVGDLIARGDFSAVWVPAFQAKDLGIALEPHLAHLAPEQRDAGEPAIARLVRAAWLLDASGDIGNRQQIEAVYVTFTAAVADVVTAFGSTR
jgi:hypothetical protein